MSNIALTDQELGHVCGGAENPFKIYSPEQIFFSIATLGGYAIHREREAAAWEEGFKDDRSARNAYNGEKEMLHAWHMGSDAAKSKT